jgi:RNA polymerase sigma-70 factor (ECF subfamily)
MTGTPEVTLDTLMARLARGDRSAFTEVFGHLWPRTLRLCQSLLGNEADAADAAQQALTKIFDRAAQYDPSLPALPWALAIASWECRTILRQRARRREVGTDALPEAALTDGEQTRIQADLVRAAIAAMGTLSDTDQETLVSTFWEEAASASGATLRKRRERALDRLRTAFRRLYGLD